VKEILYGDGIHNDLPAIQEMLDTKERLVYLPPAKKHYVINGTIYIHSNQELRLDRYTRIRLTDNANCAMLKNSDWENWNENITISGGIWDMNHSNQLPNPFHWPDPVTGITNHQLLKDPAIDRNNRKPLGIYMGFCFEFFCVKGLTFVNLTIENPVVYGADFAYVEDFTIENIKFDYYEGSPKLWNMDGVHIEGHCKNGIIRNLKGTCHDDTVALTSDDLYFGPIENIVVDGIWGKNSHSAVRMLSVNYPLKNIHITNIFGTYYVYCICLSKYYESENRSCFENITIDHIYASICSGTVDVAGNYEPLIAIGNKLDLKSLYLSHIYRNETHLAMPTVRIAEDSNIGLISAENCEQTNSTGATMPFIENHGCIDRLVLRQIDTADDPRIVNNGIIKQIIEI